MEVYADVVFLINFFMDGFILLMVCKLTKAGFSRGGLALGAFCGAFLYVLFMVLNIFNNIFAAVLMLSLSVYITFKPDNIKDFGKLLGAAHLCAFCAAGAGFAFVYSFQLGFSVKTLILATSVLYISLMLLKIWVKRTFVQKQTYYGVKIYLGEKTLTVPMLVDTGNSLIDPVGKSPVLITEFEVLKSVLPDAFCLIFSENKEDNFDYILSKLEDDSLKYRVRLLPYKSLGKRGMLLGVRPDRIEIQNGGKTLNVKDVIIGIYNFKLSDDGSYHGLLNPKILKGIA
ncbi:sporulation sigma-E factor-processing peptidase [Clostridia bacterium]|nr:sporulation sigma-E factor-processing peptidase [Clostridia bacterium]